MTSLPQARRFDWSNLGLRVASAALLAPAAIAAVWFFDPDQPFLLRAPFLLMVTVAAALMCIEWGMMVAPKASARVAAVMTVFVVGVVLLTYDRLTFDAFACIGAGALAAALVSRGHTARVVDAAYGVLYIAPACLAIVWLRDTLQGRGWTIMLLSTTWAADIGAFVVGNALKGPKLWPRFSPNKTWSGFIGGLTFSVLAAVSVAHWLMHLSLTGAALIGFLGGLATMMGDLWESMLKRRFGVKDSGDLIPGHGGLLDRVDGLMFATVVFAAARLVVRYGWAH
ncbi:MAG: phosphatidate cytidylyltransferase [Caulobacterales bacterium]